MNVAGGLIDALLDTCARFFAGKSRELSDRTIASADLSFTDFLKSAAYREAERADREYRAAGGVHNPLLIKE